MGGGTTSKAHDLSIPSTTNNGPSSGRSSMPLATRAYQQEMLDESLKGNIIIALDTGSGKTHIAVLRIKHELEKEGAKICWFLAPTVALCQQQQGVIKTYIPVPVGIISGAHHPEQWKNESLWRSVMSTHRIIVSTPQVFLDGLRHGYINLGAQIGLLVFDEAHHAVDNHPYNRIMQEFYFTSAHSRPFVLGLTASPIFGSGDVNKAFRIIEANLDARICTPRYHRAELAQFVHRPIFKHAPYMSSDTESFSTNLTTLSYAIRTLQIENDPYVIALRRQLDKAQPTSIEYRRLDQKLSKVLMKEDTFTHRGLKDFERAAGDICHDLGAWAADWFVWTVVEKAKRAANPYNNMMTTWKQTEKTYLLSILSGLVLSPVSYYEDDILGESSDKVRVLVECLLTEKEEVENLNQPFSGIIFVQRRDAVLALAELLCNHPITKHTFNIGVLLGTSESAYRHSFMDVTRHITKQSQDATIAEFKIGEKNLIISTSVAEEGIDIPACGSVIRWDPPLNMASWIQSRGRARRRRSTFTLMYNVEKDRHQNNVEKWKGLEERLVGMYQDPTRLAPEETAETSAFEPDDFDMELRIESTGAFLNPHSAVSHLSHFCAVISRSDNAENRPVYDIDPPDFLPGWHSLPTPKPLLPVYEGPWMSTVTLPRSLPIPVRAFTTDRPYLSKLAAHRHAAFKAYKALYDLGLLSDNLLPFGREMGEGVEEELAAMLADIEKRAGTARVGLQLDPWCADDDVGDVWYMSELRFSHVAPLILFTRQPMIDISLDDGPTLFRKDKDPVRVSVTPSTSIIDDVIVQKAREYTRMIFWCTAGSRMQWENTDFSYLVLPKDHHVKSEWDVKREWLEAHREQERRQREAEGEVGKSSKFNPEIAFALDGETFAKRFGHAEDVTIVRKSIQYGKAYDFVRWQHDRLPEEKEEGVKAFYEKQYPDLQLDYPLIAVRPFPPRSNFLIPIPPPTTSPQDPVDDEIHLVPRLSGIALFSPQESEYVFLLPSILRWLSLRLTVHSLRTTLFVSSPLESIPLPLLMTAITAPVSGEKNNYQRLETLGDAVLKFVVGVQVFAEYPMWHEGYLTKKKDHAVSNVRLAKEDISRRLYLWIIRDRMLSKRWKPKYATMVPLLPPAEEPTSPPPPDVDATQVGSPDVTMSSPEEEAEASKKRKKVKKQKKSNATDLSTKVLADVVESLIGAAYLHGGFDLGYECTKFFDLGIKWMPLPQRLVQILSRVEEEQDIQIPSQIADVEHMFGYTFTRKVLLIEALTHASYREHISTGSYERLEFIGDSILDMIVTEYLFHAPGKEYSPGHMHIRKSAVVNGHFLAYICLGLRREHATVMPQVVADGGLNPYQQQLNFVPGTNMHEIFFRQCLLHSSQQVLDDQTNTFTRYQQRKGEIDEALVQGTIFPWAALTRLQAPKFLSDMVESVIGAIFIDSDGNMDTVKHTLRTIGILPVLERIVTADVDVLHPVSRLSMWASRNEKKIEYLFEKERGNVACVIMVDGVEKVRETERYRGVASQEEVKFAAAERAIRQFKLRGIGMDPVKKKAKPKKKKTRH